jgi:hypothetical protein
MANKNEVSGVMRQWSVHGPDYVIPEMRPEPAPKPKPPKKKKKKVKPANWEKMLAERPKTPLTPEEYFEKIR